MKKGRIAFFVTGNVHKYQEARNVLSRSNLATAMLNIETTEIQADDIETVARNSALEAAQRSNLQVFVEDAGLFIKSLNGFPGPYSSYVYRTVSIRGVLKLMRNIRRRDAYFQSVVAFCDPNNRFRIKWFNGKVDGWITCEERGEQGFGFDPIFEPATEVGKTFAQMTLEEKNRYSHRAQAFRKFATWYALHIK